MTTPSKYDPKGVEKKWYDFWMEKELFHSEIDDREAYTIVIPPPNVTGVLHMGHILNNTIQDVLIRRARMLGKNACWVPGTDHASIATEARVVNHLAGQGIRKNDIGREKFLEYAWEWKEKHDGIIYDQLKRLGASCDWKRARFTMDENLSKAVVNAFVKLYREGLIYRGARMIHWDPKARTALSDEEVIRKEVKSQLYFVKYRIKDSEDFISIATTRPETILGDTAICVNPQDERYKNLKGKYAVVPLVEREVPVIFDDYVDMEFGTGALKITPAHDLNDYEIGMRHKLEVIDTLNEDGTLSEAAGLYIGRDRFEARKLAVADLEKEGRIEKVEEITNNVGFSERNPDTVVEPKISTQWFLKMDDLVKPALDAVKNGEIRIYPSKFEKIYTIWLENIKDWCISRQLWWGHRIPAWYEGNGEIIVAAGEDEALKEFGEKGISIKSGKIRQDEDVLDTWFSSWLWPFSVFDWAGNEESSDLNYYYPTNDLVTGHDIIFFWVARMIMAGYHFTGQKPFENVYFTGMVRDRQGRKMSKSMGNSPDALELIDRFGADGVRVGMLLCAPAGNDLQFDDALCLQGRNFANKIWNALRLIKGWKADDGIETSSYSKLMAEWFRARLFKSLEELNSQYKQFRISEALMNVYKLVWDDFCSWYLELVKPEYGSGIDRETRDNTAEFFDILMRMLHPFMPFISEELWQQLKARNGASIVNAAWPQAGKYDEKLLERMAFNQSIVSNIRQIRAEQNIANKESLELLYTKENKLLIGELIQKLGNISSLKKVGEKPEKSKSFIVDRSDYFIPLTTSLDIDGERKRISKELEYTKGFLKSVENKLGNERFVKSAPDKVVELERRKKADAEARLKVLEKQLQEL